jgi:hypothetical protein
MDVHPSRVPGLRPTSTMLAALYGTLALHLWRDPSVDESDAYSLFYTRSSGWDGSRKPGKALRAASGV